MMPQHRAYPEPVHTHKALAAAKHKCFVESYERTDGGPGYWSVCDRPIADAATDMLRSALHACKPVPRVQYHLPTTT